MYICTICDLFAGLSFASVLHHIGNTHRYDPGLSIVCGIDSCPEVYTNFESFRSHVFRKHRDDLYSCSSSSKNESQQQGGDAEDQFLLASDRWSNLGGDESDDMVLDGSVEDDIK